MTRLPDESISFQNTTGDSGVENLFVYGKLNYNFDNDDIKARSINISGDLTGSSFSGSGANLTGLAGREVYGFTGIGKSLSLTTTNGGADNITNATYVSFEESFIGPSGLSFSINTSGNLIMTV